MKETGSCLKKIKARTGAGSGFLTSLHNYGNKTEINMLSCLHQKLPPICQRNHSQ